MPVVGTWDGAARRIYLATTDFAPIDLYREYRIQRRTDEAFRAWDPLLEMSGAVSKGAGRFTPRLMTLLDGAKIVPLDVTHTLTITGEIITDDADVDPSIIDTASLSAASKVQVNYQPAEAEIIQIVGGSGLSSEQDEALTRIDTSVAGTSGYVWEIQSWVRRPLARTPRRLS